MENKEKYSQSAISVDRVPLARVFWGYGVIGFFIIAVLGNWFIGAMQNKKMASGIALLVSFIYTVGWINVAWRFSGNYKGFLLWRLLTKVVITIIAMMWVYIIGRLSIHFLG